MSVRHTHRSWLAAVLIGASLWGCAARVSLRVPPAAIAELPLERKLTLLDAENDLLAAQDARDAQEDAWYHARDLIDDANKRRSEADEQRARAKKSGAPLETFEAQIKEAVARIHYAESEEDLQLAMLKASDGQLLLAQAKYELVRANEVEAAALPGAAGVKVPDYQKQVDRLAKVAADRQAEVAKQKEKTQAVKDKWTQARAELMQASGGGVGSAWVP
ncbi:MAG: hypothetical protein JST92_23385 [Deltaproteobacteria bacterium]|nr:hypothetical protein [Deltaproteobacteria bacterium]